MASAAYLTADPMAHHVQTDDDGDMDEKDFSDETPEESDYSETDDSDDDPTFSETLSSLSRLSVQKKKSASSSSVLKSGSKCKRRLESELLGEVVDEVDQKSFDTVQSLIRDGKLEKLKIDQCKVYLRKYGLRLTGNKDTLIERIREHIRILNGGGEREYPPSSFVLNCKGDACMGDVVMFEQRVYESFDLASRRGPPVGTRVVAGRIVKESYGAAKQQHTFTIEVLWSRGEKPLPPLHPLLIKGRNLYRMKTMRQRWEDETLREKALRDKHSRGEAARTDREMRILKKNMKKELRAKRLPRVSKSNKDQAPSTQQPLRSLSQRHDNQGFNQPAKFVDRSIGPRTVLGQQNNQYALQKVSQAKHPLRHEHNVHLHSVRGQVPAHRGFTNINDRLHHHHHGSSQTVSNHKHGMVSHPQATKTHPDLLPARGYYQHPTRQATETHPALLPQATKTYPDLLPARGYYQHPTRQANETHRALLPQATKTHPDLLPARGYYQHPTLQPCWYFAQGRCHFGSNCKFSHDQ